MGSADHAGQPPGQLMADRALALCGTRFRLHGRDPQYGLDCIGLIDQCLRYAGIEASIPTGYAIRFVRQDIIEEAIDRAGLHRLTAGSPEQDGDLVLVRPSPIQYHFLVQVPGGFVHADAGQRAVRFCKPPAPWPVCNTYRLAA